MTGPKEINRVMLATRILSLFFLTLTLTHRAFAYDETWMILQARTHLSDHQQLWVDTVRRDNGDPYTNKNLALIRGAYGFQTLGWLFLVGGAYLDFKLPQSEVRLHQFAIRNFKLHESLNLITRLGLEQRFFNSDSNTYWRWRARFQFNTFPQKRMAPSFYNESLGHLDGGRRFIDGFNENRFGAGIRWTFHPIDFYVYHTRGDLQTKLQNRQVEWLQLMILADF